MKKIIAAIIRVIMPKAVKKHEEEEKARRIHNANEIQHLLRKEHAIADLYNADNNTVYTTAKALDMAKLENRTDYNRHLALKMADFR